MDFPGDISLDKSLGSFVYNNVIVKNPELRTKALRCYANDSINTKVFNNIVIGPVDFCGQKLFTENNAFKAENDQSYPGFVNAKLDIEFNSTADFRNFFGIRENSPLRNAGSRKDAPEFDRDGVIRNAKEGIDIGCYQWENGKNN